MEDTQAYIHAAIQAAKEENPSEMQEFLGAALSDKISDAIDLKKIAFAGELFNEKNDDEDDEDDEDDDENDEEEEEENGKNGKKRKKKNPFAKNGDKDEDDDEDVEMVDEVSRARRARLGGFSNKTDKGTNRRRVKRDARDFEHLGRFNKYHGEKGYEFDPERYFVGKNRNSRVGNTKDKVIMHKALAQQGSRIAKQENERQRLNLTMKQHAKKLRQAGQPDAHSDPTEWPPEWPRGEGHSRFQHPIDRRGPGTKKPRIKRD